MRRLTHAILLAPTLAIALAACTRGPDPAVTLQVKEDLTQICQAQRSYLESKKNLKTVKDYELQQERARHFVDDVKGRLVKEALLEASQAPLGVRRKPLDSAAAKAGLKDWSCPELDQL